MNKWLKPLLILAVMLGGCAADWQTKRLAEARLKGNAPVTVIEGFLDLGFTENHGLVFGVLNHKLQEAGRAVLVGVRIVLTLGLTVVIWRNRSRSLLFLSALALVWAGAAGNSIDPFVYGYVVDFIHIHLGRVLDWPFYFNVADAWVTVGVAGLLVSYPAAETKTA